MSLIDVEGLKAFLFSHDLNAWADQLDAQIEYALQDQLHGDFSRWVEVLNNIPANIAPGDINLNSNAVGARNNDITDEERALLLEQLKQLRPWRKGPYHFHGIDIDTEWRSDWKWDRLLPHISELTDRKVLDVGCGNGYHCWRMLGAGAEMVVGIDPGKLFLIQYMAVQRLLGSSLPFVFLPLKSEDIPLNLKVFDTVFSMGVLYHRRAPIDHLAELKRALKPGGELVLETLVIEGGENEVLVPEDRYAQMRNVWFIPSVGQLERWLSRCGFENIRLVDLNRTTTEEQRKTDWMPFDSLEKFLDPEDQTRTIEGYSSPLRAIMIAHA